MTATSLKASLPQYSILRTLDFCNTRKENKYTGVIGRVFAAYILQMHYMELVNTMQSYVTKQQQHSPLQSLQGNRNQSFYYPMSSQ